MDNTNNINNSFADNQKNVSQQPKAEPSINSLINQTPANEQHQPENTTKSDPSLHISPSKNPEIAVTTSAEPNNQPLVLENIESENSRGLESLLKKINQGLKDRQFQGNLPLNVKIGGSVVFQAVSGKKPTINKVTLEQVMLLEKALSTPKGIRGAVRISVGGETVFHVKDGELKVDKLGLAGQTTGSKPTQAPQPVPKSKSSAQPQPHQAQLGQTPPTQHQPTQAQSASLEEQIALLQATIERQQVQLDQMSQLLERFINSPTVILVGNDQLKNWFSDLNLKIQQAGFQAIANSKSQLEQNKTTLLSKVKQLWTGAKEAVTDKIHATRNAIGAKASDLALGAVDATTKLASAVGEKLSDGTVVLESRNRNQRLELSTNSVSLQVRSPIDPVAQWNKFSQGIEDVVKDRPVQYSLAVARNAVRHGMSRTSVEDMLVADPQYQKIRTELGHNAAQKYAGQTARSAERREQPSLRAQQERRRSFNNGLQR